MEEIRSEQSHHVVHNPWDRREGDISAEEVRHFLADSGGIESHRTIRHAACHCGCIKPPGGFCSACQEMICVDCFSRCEACGKPVGPWCSGLIQNTTGQILYLCRECSSSVKRRKIFRAISFPFRMFLSLFVEFEE